ncbi:MAG TPA: FAD-dependent oxidoreductase, partial [Devosiaceae bacterium]|nr:FAD-dependent oxidoreductase [Devosiaceae bacterium]
MRCRLADTGTHRLGGSAIERTQELAFKLDGRQFAAFAGDTVLSAVMAAGWYGFGEHLGASLQLTEDSPFYVHPAGTAGGFRDVIHAARLPAADGLELSALAPLSPPRALHNPFRRRHEGLRSLEQPLVPPEPSRDGVRLAASARSEETDLIVVGGGVAGLAAAAEAARQGLRVSLFERGGALGGIADYYGRAEGERAPGDVAGELAAAVAAAETVTVHRFAEVTSAGDGAVIAIATETGEYGAAAAARLTLRAPRIVLATGGREKLPLFAGNRAVGVLPSISAWRMAALYGVWHGQAVQFFTATSDAYRLALSLADAGVSVGRIYDARNNPASRFIAYAKAYGIRLNPGTRVEAVER